MFGDCRSYTSKELWPSHVITGATTFQPSPFVKYHLQASEPKCVDVTHTSIKSLLHQKDVAAAAAQHLLNLNSFILPTLLHLLLLHPIGPPLHPQLPQP